MAIVTPLAHPARELVRIVVQPGSRPGDADRAEQLDRAVTGVPAPHAPVHLQALGELPADGEHRVEGGAGVLKYHPDVRPSYSPHALVVKGEEVAAPEAHFLGLDAGCGGAVAGAERDSMVAVLPQPLSPTSARASPRRTEKLTPLTACTARLGPVRKRVRRAADSQEVAGCVVGTLQASWIRLGAG